MNFPRLSQALPAAALAALLLVPACTMKSAKQDPAADESQTSLAPPEKDAPANATQEAAPEAAQPSTPAAAQDPKSPRQAAAVAKPESNPAVGHSMARELKSFSSQSTAAYILDNSSPALDAMALAAPAAPPAAGLLAKRSGAVGNRAERKRKPEAGAGGWDVRGDKPFNTEEYSRIYENAFLEVRNNPLSTFSIDVDAASYANVRRFLQGNQLPPPDAVRIEELINYFDYDYPRPENDAPFSITTEVASTPWNDKTRLVHVGLQGVRIENGKLPPNNLVFLIDVSGSMADDAKLPLLKRAFRLLTDQMRPEDRVAMVVYAGAAGVVLPSTAGKDKAAILEALERLSAGGSTAGGEGIVLAYEVAKKNFIPGGNNRIVLATDGDFNVGVSSDGDLARLIEEKRKSGVFLSVLGFGMGNYKDAKMEQLADKGNGNYAYIDNIREARKVLVEEMGGTLVTIAKDVKLQVEFNPARVEAYRLIGYENRMLRSEDFNDDAKDAGELGAGHSVTALYEVVPAGTGMRLPAVDSLKYQQPAAFQKPAAGTGRESGELLTVKFRYKDPNGTRSKLISRTLSDRGGAWSSASADFRFSAAVAGFGMLLRGSEHKGDLEYARVLSMAQAAAGKDAQGHRAEFVRIAEAARLLAAGQRFGAK